MTDSTDDVTFVPLATVLVACSDRRATAVVESTLRGLHCDAVAVRYGPAALSAAAGFGRTFDLVIADEAVVGLSGLDLIQAVRAVQPRILAILIANDTPEIRRRAAAARAMVLPKPLRVAILARIVVEVLAAR